MAVSWKDPDFFAVSRLTVWCDSPFLQVVLTMRICHIPHFYYHPDYIFLPLSTPTIFFPSTVPSIFKLTDLHYLRIHDLLICLALLRVRVFHELNFYSTRILILLHFEPCRPTKGSSVSYNNTSFKKKTIFPSAFLVFLLSTFH